MQLIDGGVRENIAWKELKEIGAEKILGINFESNEDITDCCKNMIEILERSIGLMEHELASYELKGIDELITIATKKVGLLEISQIDYLYETGYKIAKKY